MPETDAMRFLAGLLWALALYSAGMRVVARRAVLARLRGSGEGPGRPPARKDRTARVLVWAGRFSPNRADERTVRRLMRAGYRGAQALAAYNGARLVAGVVGGLVCTASTAPVAPGTAMRLLTAGLGFMLLRMACGIYLDRLGGMRTARIRSGLPDTIDLLTVCVEAGLGLDAAFTHVSQRGRGPLAEEFAFLLRVIRLGSPRGDALREMADRIGIDDLSSFVRSLIQADQLGTGISVVMRVQSVRLRGRQRQAAQEKAMKAPVKMVFPMILLIFPFMFIIMIGPALIRVVEMLGKG